MEFSISDSVYVETTVTIAFATIGLGFFCEDIGIIGRVWMILENLIIVEGGLLEAKRNVSAVTVVSQSHTFKSTHAEIRFGWGKKLISRKFVENYEEKTLFRLFILKNNENQSVIVEEVDKIDYSKVKQRVEQGDSIFITRGRKEKAKTNFVERDKTAESLFFPYI